MKSSCKVGLLEEYRHELLAGAMPVHLRNLADRSQLCLIAKAAVNLQ